MPTENATDAEITEALEKLVTDAISAGTFVILEANPSRNYYVQFALQGDRLYCEAASNQYLEPPDQLDDEQLVTLENLGWRAPEHEGQNNFRTFRPKQQSDYVEIIALVRRLLHDVYRLDVNVPLSMTRSWDDQVLAPETSIRFASEGHRSTYSQVVAYATELYGDSLRLDHRRPLLFIEHGSTITTVAVDPVRTHSSLIGFYSFLVRDLETTPELMHWLLETNYRMRVGALCIDREGNVLLTHSVIGDTITQEELQAVLTKLVEQADELDEQITRRFGGYTARDLAHR